jgi:hypothetical protein
MSCQASARSTSLRIASNTAIARRAISRSDSGSAHERDVGALDLGTELGRLVAMALRIPDRLSERRVGGLERSRAAKRPAEVAEQ